MKLPMLGSEVEWKFLPTSLKQVGICVFILLPGEVFTDRMVTTYQADPRNKPAKVSRYVVKNHCGVGYAIIPEGIFKKGLAVVLDKPLVPMTISWELL
jgi:hypothetical protein